MEFSGAAAAAGRKEIRFLCMEAGAGDEQVTIPSPSSSSSPSPTIAAGDAAAVEREHMFEKVVTPSDVGKLNRLVIPKQHAERFFPLDAGAGAGDEKSGLLLGFEDCRTGKQWRFRYSYWNSSQSYVMTKGWSRFVKEKRLDAGDTVSFSRSAAAVDSSSAGAGARGRRLFIDWKRRLDAVPSAEINHLSFLPPQPPGSSPFFFPRRHAAAAAAPPIGSSWGRSRILFPSPATTHLPFNVSDAGAGVAHQYQLVLRDGGAGAAPSILESVPVAHSKAAAAAVATTKRVRLFGVNLDCHEQHAAVDDSPEPAGVLLPAAPPTTLPLYLHLGAAPPPIKEQQP